MHFAYAFCKTPRFLTEMTANFITNVQDNPQNDEENCNKYRVSENF